MNKKVSRRKLADGLSSTFNRYGVLVTYGIIFHDDCFKSENDTPEFIIQLFGGSLSELSQELNALRSFYNFDFYLKWSAPCAIGKPFNVRNDNEYLNQLINHLNSQNL